jgi:uncharacterized protein YjdB
LIEAANNSEKPLIISSPAIQFVTWLDNINAKPKVAAINSTTLIIKATSTLNLNRFGGHDNMKENGKYL